MDIETLALELQKTADRAERNTGRIKKLEEEHEAIHQIATSVAVMAEKMDSMKEKFGSKDGVKEDTEQPDEKKETEKKEERKPWELTPEQIQAINDAIAANLDFNGEDKNY